MRLSVADLKERERAAWALYGPCRLCARYCTVDRTRGEAGFCVVGTDAHVAGWGVHFGEEPELTGTAGCGLILFGACNLACAGCETASFSRERKGVRKTTAAELAGILLEFERRAPASVQFVTPTHQLPVIVSAIRRAAERGFSRTIVWNCGGYESPEALAILDGVVDVYLPDLKHGDDTEGKITGVSDYWTVASACVREMHRQVGDVQLDEAGLARRGVIVRHLVLPDGAAGSAKVLAFLAAISPNLRVNVMAQFQPVYQLAGHVRLGRRVSAAEVETVRRLAADVGLVNAFSLK